MHVSEKRLFEERKEVLALSAGTRNPLFSRSTIAAHIKMSVNIIFGLLYFIFLLVYGA